MNIIGISGKKRSGKNTVANFLNGVVMKKNGLIADFRMTDLGELEILTQFQDGSTDWGILDLYRKDEAFVKSVEDMLWPFVKNYSFADALKASAIELFGLSPSSVYGSEEERAEPTHLMWEDMPGVAPPDEMCWASMLGKDYEDKDVNRIVRGLDLVIHQSGPMSGRDFMQYWGTDIARKMYKDVWINCTLKNILREGSELALITDVRFPDEVAAIKKAGGLCIRLDKVTNDDKHSSEVALDPSVYDWKNFDYVVHNQDQTLSETMLTVEKLLTGVV